MKYLNILLFTFLFILPIDNMEAQVTLFDDLLEQLDSTDQANYLNELDSFPDFNALDSFPNLDIPLSNGDMLDSLFLYLDSLPVLDSSYLNAFSFGADTLLHLDTTGASSNIYFDSLNLDTIFNEFNNIDSIFNMNFDSLSIIDSLYQDSVSFNPADTVDLGLIDNAIDENLLSLWDTASNTGNNVDTTNIGTFGNIFNQLFGGDNFTKLELAFGIQHSSVNYYSNRYYPKAKVIRVGSVPSLETMMESTWHIQGAFIDKNIEAFISDDSNQNSSNNDEVVPLSLDADYAAMLNPSLFSFGSLNVRLLTSIGMEFGVYAPAHKDANSDNLGYTTGLGVQAGTGFAIQSGDLTIYTQTTFAYGNVIKSDADYRYNSLKISAGVNYSDIINIRYSTGNQSWSPNGNRTLDVSHQLTVGVILQSLKR